MVTLPTLFDLNEHLPVYEGCTIIDGDARSMPPQIFQKRYGVIIADPPWEYRVSKGEGTAKEQYDLLTDADLRAMPVPRLAKDDSVLLLWCTWPKLDEGMALIASWGFEYVTGLPWVKLTKEGGNISYGVGYWVRGCSEPILIARRGHVSPPRLEGFLGLLSPNMKHSRKPADLHQIAEALPGPRLELFARQPRDGWTVFGNQLGAYSND